MSKKTVLSIVPVKKGTCKFTKEFQKLLPPKTIPHKLLKTTERFRIYSVSWNGMKCTFVAKLLMTDYSNLILC